MKIVHLSTSDHGGAGLACLTLHKALRSSGVDSKMLVLERKGEDEEVYLFEHGSDRGLPPWSWIFPYIDLTAKKIGIPISRSRYYARRIARLQGPGRPVLFTAPFTEYDVTEHALVRDADIVHLHWVAGFLDYPSFFPRVKRPVLWTIRDEYPFLGGFHYRGEKERANGRFDAIEKNFFDVKRRSVALSPDLTIVSLSQKMMEPTQKSGMFAGRRHHLVHNPVDPVVFRLHDRIRSREILGLPREAKIILFVAQDIREPRKGLRELLQALSVLSRPDILLCVVGADRSGETLPVAHRSMGLVRDERLMSVVYSAADVHVMPSSEESFGKTMTESLACGTPVVAFSSGIAPELIDGRNGILISAMTVDALAEGVKKALLTDFDRERIRNDVVGRFGLEKIVSQYIDLYRKMSAGERV